MAIGQAGEQGGHSDGAGLDGHHRPRTGQAGQAERQQHEGEEREVVGVVPHETLLHGLPGPPAQHQGNSGLFQPRPAPQDQYENGGKQSHIDQGIPVLDVAARGQAHGGLVTQSDREGTPNVAGYVPQALAGRGEGDRRDQHKRQGTSQHGAAPVTGISGQGEDQERGRNEADVDLDQKLEAGQGAEHAQKRQASGGTGGPERRQRQAEGSGQRQLGRLEQVGADAQRGPGDDAGQEEAPLRAQGRDDQGCQSPRDGQDVNEPQAGG